MPAARIFGAQELERVDHDVADALDLVRGDALAREMLVAVRRRRPKHDRRSASVTRRLISSGMRAVAAAQPRLEMRDAESTASRRRARTRASSSRRRRRRSNPGRDARQTFSYSIMTRPVCSPWLAAADTEMDMRLRQLQVGEERVRHVRVVVLAGVHDARRHHGSAASAW